ncbi:hypothetical protein [Loktanella salsilacus]|uniref:hypothetical protein n=1 Tax=Loktanella salsilacus TaxID=195913 RepID=UPI00373626E1
MIRKMLSHVSNLSLTAFTMLAVSSMPAAAAPTAGEAATNLIGNFTGIAKLLISGAFLAGAFFVVAGIFKIKAAADTQGQQVKYSEGLWRILIGAALCLSPWVISVAMASITGDSAPTLAPSGGLTFSSK